MSDRFGVWFLAGALCFMTTMSAVVAFQRFPDRSVFALVMWAVIAVALVAPWFHIRGLLSSEAQDPRAARRRCSRLVILLYLPLASTLLLLANVAR